LFFSTDSMRSIDLQPDRLALVRTILWQLVPGLEVRAFGSRVTGTAKPMSDLDLCIMGESRLPSDAMDKVRAAFSESALPFKVDVVEWAALSEAFRAIIDKQFAVVQMVD